MESSGQARENGIGTIFNASKNKKNPTNKKRQAKKRYIDLFCSLIAQTAKIAPAIKNKKGMTTDSREKPCTAANNDSMPPTMQRSPSANNTREAAVF